MIDPSTALIIGEINVRFNFDIVKLAEANSVGVGIVHDSYTFDFDHASPEQQAAFEQALNERFEVYKGDVITALQAHNA